MTDQHTYIQRRIRAGWGILISGVVLFAAGLGLQLLFAVPFNARIISGLGIALTGAGIGACYATGPAVKTFRQHGGLRTKNSMNAT